MRHAAIHRVIPGLVPGMTEPSEAAERTHSPQAPATRRFGHENRGTLAEMFAIEDVLQQLLVHSGSGDHTGQGARAPTRLTWGFT